MGFALIALALLAAPALAVAPGTSPGAGLTVGPAFLLRSLQLADGLPDASVNAIAQTADGYLWLGTPRGLARFDGLELELWPVGEGRDRFTRPVHSLLASPDGALWVGVVGAVWRRQRGAWRRFELPAELEQQAVRQMVPGRPDDLWLLTQSAVVRLSGDETGMWEPSRLLADVSLLSLAVGADASLWVGTRAGPWRLPPDGGPPQRWLAVGDLVVPALLVETDRTVWLGTSQGLVRASDQVASQAPVTVGRTLRVRALLRSFDGTLWVGTHGQGVWRQDDNRGLVRCEGLAGLAKAIVTTLAEDREGGLWIGTSGSGVYQVRPVPLRLAGRGEGLPSDLVSCVLDDLGGGLWVGTHGGGLVRWRGGLVDRASGPPALDSSSVTALCRDAAGRLWVGTERDGLLRLEHGRLEPHVEAGHMVGPTVLALATDAEGGLWVGSSRGLFRLVDGRVDRAWSLGGRSSVHCVVPESAEGAWVGTSGGLFRVDARVSKRVTLEVGSRAEEVSSMLELAPGELLVGVAGGGAYRVGGEKTVRLGAREGLLDDPVFHLSSTGDGGVWMLTDRELVRVSRNDLVKLDGGACDPVPRRVLGIGEGLPGKAPVSPGWPAVAELPGGWLAIATAAGVAWLDPAAGAEPTPPPVVIERVVADGAEVTGGGPVELGPGIGRIEFQFAALDFRTPRSTRYRYRLDGVDRRWVEAGASRSTTYAHLAPGDYVFTVTAATRSGDWNPEPTRFPFRVRAHFWQTRAFLVAAILLLAAGVVGAHHLRLRQVLRQRQHLDEPVDQGTRELAEGDDPSITSQVRSAPPG